MSAKNFKLFEVGQCHLVQRESGGRWRKSSGKEKGNARGKGRAEAPNRR
jgi:hypothetical protein